MTTEPIQFITNQDPVDAEVITDEKRVMNAEVIDDASPALAKPPCVTAPGDIHPDRPTQSMKPDGISWPVWIFHLLGHGIEWCFGVFCLVFFLAQIAAVPILQFISLGYLLHVSGRIVQTGRFRDGFLHIKAMARLGSIVFGAWLFLWFSRYVSGVAYAASLIDENSGWTRGLRFTLLLVTVLVVGHILSAWYSGGRLRHFFWPILMPFQLFGWMLRRAAASPSIRPLFDYSIGLVSPGLVQDICDSKPLTDWFVPAILYNAITSGELYIQARDAVWEFVVDLNLAYYFWLGLRGFVATVLWLIIPVMFLMASTSSLDGVNVLCGFVGVFTMSIVVLYLPFLQAHFAAENRFGAMFELGKVREDFARAPIAFWLALVMCLSFSVPLYLMMIEFLPAEVTWLLAIVFVTFMLPSRFVTGWAVARARRAEERSFFLWRWMSRLAGFPFAFVYALINLAAPFLVWNGKLGLFEQHAFLLPTPFPGIFN